MYSTSDTITALQLFEQGLSKGAIDNMAMNAVESVLEQGNIAQVAEAVAAMKEFVKRVEDNDRFVEYVREEASKEKGGIITPSGAKIEAIEAGVKYDFSKCGDLELVEREQMLESAKYMVDERKAFLKKVPYSGMEIRYKDELITVYPPSKSSTSSYKVTLSK